MAKRLEDVILDATLNEWATGTVLHVCSGEPVDFADMVAKSLATATIGPSDFSSPENGDTSGRKVTFLGAADLNIDFSGTADHVATGVTVGSVYHGATTVASQPLTAGGTVSVGAYKLENRDPA